MQFHYCYWILFYTPLICGELLFKFDNNDPCNTHCENTNLNLPKVNYIKSCCHRGCRFFKLIETDFGLLNNTNKACKDSCNEAYVDMYERFACYKGCNTMARNRIKDFILSCSPKSETDLNQLLSDIPEPDILSDPGLRKELMPGWWHSGFKLPQTNIKTVPKHSKINDYASVPDYAADVVEISTTNKLSTWRLDLICGIPFALGFLLFVINIVASFHLWFRFFCRRCGTAAETSKPAQFKKTLHILTPNSL